MTSFEQCTCQENLSRMLTEEEMEELEVNIGDQEQTVLVRWKCRAVRWACNRLYTGHPLASPRNWLPLHNMLPPLLPQNNTACMPCRPIVLADRRGRDRA